MNAPLPQKLPPGYHGRGVEATALAELAVLVLVPVFALSRLAAWIDWRVVLGGSVAMPLVTYFLYGFDKHRAETNGQRVPETTLHLVELFGGWPGAFLAQRKFRHKIAKSSYQIGFWLIVLIHQFVALDFLCGWRFTGGVWGLFTTHTD